MTEHGPVAPAAYPQLNNLTKPIRGAAAKAGDPERMSMWAGQTYSQARPMPAAQLVQQLMAEAREAMAGARDRLSPSASDAL